MWIVTGITEKGETKKYNISVSRDTDKALVLAQAFQMHGRAHGEDPLSLDAKVEWTSDNVQSIPAFVLKTLSNYAVDKRVGKGQWERHSVRAFRSLEAATEALESAASEFPGEKFRVVETVNVTSVVAVSKNAKDAVEETPDKEAETPKGDETKEAPKETKATPKAPTKTPAKAA